MTLARRALVVAALVVAALGAGGLVACGDKSAAPSSEGAHAVSSGAGSSGAGSSGAGSSGAGSSGTANGVVARRAVTTSASGAVTSGAASMPPAVASAGERAVDAAPSASGSAPPPDPASQGPAVDELFKVTPPEGATPRPLFQAGAPSGVVVLVPKEMKEGSGTYGEGYGTSTETAGTMTSRVELEIETPSGDPKVVKLSELQLKQLCYKVGVDKITWEPAAPVTLPEGALPALVWRGRGTSIKKTDWGVLALSTAVAKRQVTGCGSWDGAHPDLEGSVVRVLASLRPGQGAKTDPGNP